MGGDARRRRLPIQSAASSSRWRFGFLGARTWKHSMSTGAHPHRPIQPPGGPTRRVLLPLPLRPSTPRIPPLPAPSPLEHSLASVIKMKQASQSRRGETM